MANKLSISRAIDASVRRANELRKRAPDLSKDSDRQDCEVEIGEIINSLALSMDKVMNAVWTKFVYDTANKPNVYFPCVTTKEKFDARMKKYRLGNLLQNAPTLYSELEAIQPYNLGEKGWWKLLYDLALIRHDSFPEIQPSKAGVGNSLGIGKGQNLFIRELSIDNGVMKFDGEAWNQKTGQKEPVKFEFFKAVEAELAGTGQNPLNFVIACSEKVSEVAKRIGAHL